MPNKTEQKYFFSIQPYWSCLEKDQHLTTDRVSITHFHWNQEELECVPGNGQVGIMLSGPEAFQGFCYGVLDTKGSIPLHGLTDGYFMRFSPGTFSQICNIPANLIPAEGLDLRDVFSPSQVEEMRCAIGKPDPGTALLQMIGAWSESPDSRTCSRERSLVEEVTQLIWERQGNIRVRDLEEKTMYSSRYIQSVVGSQVGVAPKQLCAQIRFQQALFLLCRYPQITLSQIAQILGYSDQAHFSREFKRFSGISPTIYQKK